MRFTKLVAVCLVALAPLGARAVDAPHTEGSACSDCHVGHTAPGASLTKFEGNFSLCQDCHTDPSYTGHFGFPWAASQQAVPGVSGRSHSWSGSASNLGATPPSPSSTNPDEAAMARRLDGNNIMCSTCHDQHQADTFPASGRGTQHISPVTKPVSKGGGGTVAVTSAPAGLAARPYTLQFTTGGGVGAAVFQVSNDRKLSWIQTNVSTAASVTLADGVVLAFDGTTFVAGEEYAFYVSYPFMRVSNTDARMCTICHKDRNMTTVNVEGGGSHAGTSQPIVPGTTVFHHPVNESFDSPVTPLDANGAPQTTGDSNPANDLVLGTNGIVTCLTCHRVHNAISNSLP